MNNEDLQYWSLRHNIVKLLMLTANIYVLPCTMAIAY